jgi:hypothetical protein
MKKVCKYCNKEIKGKSKNYDYYYFCNNIDCLDKYLNEPEKKIFFIYDERARVMDLDDCTILMSVNTEKEGIKEAKKLNGVIVEAIYDTDNKIIIKTIIN